MSTFNLYMNGKSWEEQLTQCNEDFEICDLVFVYGTLKTSYGNNRLLSTSQLVEGDAVTKDNFLLGNVGYPVAFPTQVVPSQHHHLAFPVVGEVWAMDTPLTFSDLDFLEGHPEWYERRLTMTQSGKRVWMYMMPHFDVSRNCGPCDFDSERRTWTWRSN